MRTGRLDDVDQRLLDDPIRRQLDAAGERVRLSIDGERDLEPRPPELLEQPGELIETRLRSQLRGLAVAA